MNNFFEKLILNFKELVDDAVSASASIAKMGVSGRKLFKERKTISKFTRDIQSDVYKAKTNSYKPLKKIKRDTSSIKKEVNKLQKRHFFLLYKNKD